MSHEHAVDPHCRNCGAELHGPFCHACGQKAVAATVGVHDFVHEATHEFLHLDGKIGRTVKLLVTRPGQLTKEFVEGRRARYISPLRVYLTCSLLFFFLAAVIPGAREGIITIQKSDVRDAKQRQLTDEQAEREAVKLEEAIMHNFPRVMFVLMPFFALLTFAFFRRSQPYFVPHLYYSVHFHAFAFLVMAVTTAFGIFGKAGKAMGAVIFLANVPYHFAGLRRFFAQSWPATLWKGTLIGVLYWLGIALAMVAMILIALKL